MTTPRPEALTAEEEAELRRELDFGGQLSSVPALWLRVRRLVATLDAARAARPESGPCEECGWYPNIWPEDSAKRDDAAERHNAHVIARAARPETVVDVLDGVPHDHENGACTACLRDGYKRGVAARPEAGLREALDTLTSLIAAADTGEDVIHLAVTPTLRAALCATPPADAPLDARERVEAEVRATHPYGFRSGEWAVITGVEWVNGRPCYRVRFPDGATDSWVIISDSLDPYEFRRSTGAEPMTTPRPEGHRIGVTQSRTYYPDSIYRNRDRFDARTPRPEAPMPEDLTGRGSGGEFGRGYAAGWNAAVRFFDAARAARPETGLREAAQTLVHFAGRYSAGDIDIDRGDLQVAIEEVERALATPPADAPLDVALAEVLHDVMCDISHHDRPPARCSKWARYPLIAAAAAPRLAARFTDGEAGDERTTR